LDSGMKLLEELHPDIVFLDNNLPDGSGWNTADEIMEKHPQLQLNLISTHQNDFIKREKPSIRIWEKPLKLTELGKMF
jgi:two-component system, OmpR family, response regulator